MERLRRLLRNARIRGDLIAVANLEARIKAEWLKVGWTEAELREAWGK
jgi:hypothetical protein